MRHISASRKSRLLIPLTVQNPADGGDQIAPAGFNPFFQFSFECAALRRVSRRGNHRCNEWSTLPQPIPGPGKTGIRFPFSPVVGSDLFGMAFLFGDFGQDLVDFPDFSRRRVERLVDGERLSRQLPGFGQAAGLWFCRRTARLLSALETPN